MNSISFSEQSLTLLNSFQKEFTLKKPDKYLKKEPNIFISLYKKILGTNDDKAKELNKQWYYVHFLTKNINNIQKYIHIESNDEIMKNTFSLFLSLKQLGLISNFSLVKKIEPSDKYFEKSIGDIEKIDKLIVTVAPNYKLISNNDLYIIEKQSIENTFIINVDKKDLSKKQKAIKYLSEIPEVKLISSYKNPETKNSLISGYTQRNSYNFKKNELGYFCSDRYLNKNGLKGENQIITILDTPIDINHAMFRDDEVPIDFKKEMPNHRKIMYYNFDGTKEDLINKIEENEHGTHVSGTAAGKSLCKDEIFNISNLDGNAPEAKILYAGNYDKHDEMASLMNKFHSTISSNSWGSTDYNPQFNYFGETIAYRNPQSVFIFAAGNEYKLLNGNFSVCDPGGSKNVLTVGAIDSFYEIHAMKYILTNLDYTSEKYTIYSIWNIRDPWIIGEVTTNSFDSSRILAIDSSKGNQCKFMEGTKTTILYRGRPDWLSECNISFHSQLFNVRSDPNIDKLLESNPNISIKHELSIIKEKTINKASLSSTGPGYRGILKPDVMSPGMNVLSAKSIKNSKDPHRYFEYFPGDFVFMDGTSMATPNIAGAMALVHQYFNSGRWIEKVQLDGSTSRALLIYSAKHPSNSKTPDIWFGHGVADISTILPIGNNFGVRITRQGEKDDFSKHSVTENGHVVAKLLVNQSLYEYKRELQITMSYIDQLMNIESPIPIARDLDLIVVSPSKRIYIGDHLENEDTQHASTNEKIFIDENRLENGEYTIHIYGGAFADSGISNEKEKQNFAVVATGPIENGFIDFVESNECPCDKCDENRPGFCICKDYNENVGQVCQAYVETINGNTGNFTVGPLRIKRVRFVSDKKIKSIHSKSNYPGRYSTIWASDKCHLALGEYEINGQTGTENDEKVTKVGFGKNEICIAIFNNNDKDSTYFIEISDKAPFNWFLVIVIAAVAVIVIIIIISIICCVKKCKCCKKKDLYDSTTAQSLLAEQNANIH